MMLRLDRAAIVAMTPDVHRVVDSREPTSYLVLRDYLVENLSMLACYYAAGNE